MMTPKTLLLAFLIIASSLPTGTQALAIELSQDFDSGSLDVANSTVVGTTVNLVGRKTWSQPGTQDYYRWVYFKASGVDGLRPQFNISATEFLGSLTGHRYVYSYDRADWRFFDRGVVTGGVYSFGNDAPFSQQEVYIAYSLPYPVSRTQDHVEAVASSPYVSPTASADGGLVIGQSAGGIDDLGRSIPQHNLYGYKLTDPAAGGGKAKVLLAGGNHSGEPVANYVLEGMTDFLLSSDPRAAQLRAAAEFFVYPQVNPDGRYAGYYRSNPENPEKDFNRYWNDPAGFTDLSVLTAAMQLDTGSDVDYLFDFHAFFGPGTADDFYYTVPESLDGEFSRAFALLEPDVSAFGSRGAPGMLRIWGMSPAGLNAEFAFTSETGPRPGVLEDRLFELGANYALALHRVMAVPEPPTLGLLATGLFCLLAYGRRRWTRIRLNR